MSRLQKAHFVFMAQPARQRTVQRPLRSGRRQARHRGIRLRHKGVHAHVQQIHIQHIEPEIFHHLLAQRLHHRRQVRHFSQTTAVVLQQRLGIVTAFEEDPLKRALQALAGKIEQYHGQQHKQHRQTGIGKQRLR